MASKTAFNQKKHKQNANSPRSFLEFDRANLSILVINKELQAPFFLKQVTKFSRVEIKIFAL